MQTYQLIFKGEFSEKVSDAAQQAILSQSFKLSEQDIDSLKRGESCCLKSGLTEAEGKFFQQLFHIAGATVYLITG